MQTKTTNKKRLWLIAFSLTVFLLLTAFTGLGLASAPKAQTVYADAGTEQTPVAININAVLADGEGYTYASNVVTVTDDGYYRFTGTGVATAKGIVVQSGVTANIILNNVYINRTSSDGCAFDMTGATVNLTLAGNNTLRRGSRRGGLRGSVRLRAHH